MGTEGNATLQYPSTVNGTINYKQEPILERVGEKKEEKCLSFREKLKNHEYKEKFTYSMFMTLSFCALGMYMGQSGPTFMDLQIITNTDLETASALFTGGNAGFLTGSIIVGLIYNKVNTSMLAFGMSICLGAINIFLPYCTQIEVMIAARFASAMFGGGINTGLSSEHMRLWGSEGNDLLQLLHFSYSFGGVIAPLVAEPFLAEKIVGQETTNNNMTMDELPVNSNATVPQMPQESNVRYAFLIIGIFSIVTAWPFLIVYFTRSDKSRNTVTARKFSQRNVPFPIQMSMLCGLCLFYFTYCCIEDTFFSFLMTFLVGQFDSVSKSKGALVTAIAWAAFAVSRFLMIFITKMFTPVQILLILTTAMVISFSSFSIFAYFGIVTALVVISAIAPLTFSGVFGSGLSWTEKELFPVTGIISSCVFVSGSLGPMVNPLILGYLMAERSKMWFCYLLLLETFIMYLICTGLLMFSRYFVDKKYGSLSSHVNKELEIEIEVTNELQCELKHSDTENDVHA